ncbi:MAG: RHS repeat-associated core domain-containing protein [Anaerolineales bacterium]
MGRFVSADTLVPGAGNPQALNRYAFVLNNPVKYTDPSGHDPHYCEGRSDEQTCYDSHLSSQSRRANARIYYLNSIGLGRKRIIGPSPDVRDEQAYSLYRLGLVAGAGNIKHIPVYYGEGAMGGTGVTRLQMMGEMAEVRTWSDDVASAIAQDLADNPLSPGQRLVVVGASGGGTVAVESLDLLQDKGIYVDQLILRGSPVKESALVNVGQVDYITGNYYGGVVPSDHYYSYDSNPSDGVQVQEHRVDFYGHVPPDNRSRMLVVDLIVSLVAR